MTNTGQWASKTQLVELLLMAIVLIGLANLVYFFIVKGYLPSPFVFDVNDTFMDWFNTAYWSHNDGAYAVWNTIYAPLSLVITQFLGNPRCYTQNPFAARDCDTLGIVVLCATYLICVVVSAIAMFRNDRKTALFRTVTLAIGGPLLFALERGNIIMFAFIGFVCLFGNLTKSRLAIAGAAAALINLKVYLLFPVLSFAIKRKWRTLELCGFATIGLYLFTLFIFGDGTPADLVANLKVWFNLRSGAIWDELLYSTTYKPYLLFDARQYPIRDFVEQRTIDFASRAIEIEVFASRAIAILCLIGAWFYPKAVPISRLVFFVLMQSFMAQNPGGYAIFFIVFLVFMEKWKNFATGLAIVTCYFVSIPADVTLSVFFRFETVSWLSGRLVDSAYSLSLGALIRPGMIAIILWALAIDTLIEIHREMRLSPPRLGLARTALFRRELA